MKMSRIALSILILLFTQMMSAQTSSVIGTLISTEGPVAYASIGVIGTKTGCSSDMKGKFKLDGISIGEYVIRISSIGFHVKNIPISVHGTSDLELGDVVMEVNQNSLDEVVITGTMRPMSRTDSPVPVEIYTAKFFQANPSPSLFEGLQNVNGVRPQLNCNVCNTGDIHINGLEGPYTMILMDGMPIVSGLSSVYGLSGIPQSLIERIEIVKGPASTLYGSEAVGGVINVITKDPDSAPLLSTDLMLSSWKEINMDIGVSAKLGKKSKMLLGINYFLYDDAKDVNEDGFTDITLQNRVSFFQKWTLKRKLNKPLSVALRYIWEDRWGGDMDWTPAYRGGNEIYAESIQINRWEMIGKYGIPGVQDLELHIGANGHLQDAAYGSTLFNGSQYVLYGQLTWAKSWSKRHELLSGLAYRYSYYNDDTFATGDLIHDDPSITSLPGFFLQDEWRMNEHWTVLSGLRWDHNSLHGNIFTPRLNLKRSSADKMTSLRWSFGNGYRVANVFTEDHAALTGAREVVFTEDLAPERSWNTNLNLLKKFSIQNGNFITLDMSAWYTRFSQRILPDYSDPNKIIYSNLEGYSVSRGMTMNLDMTWNNGLTTMVGITAMDVFVQATEKRFRPLLTEQYSAVWRASYTFPSLLLSMDYTANLYGPMLLPLLGPLDERPGASPWWSTQNIKLGKQFSHGINLYAGIKNILDYTPPGNSIARPFDPFDQEVNFDAQGQVIATAANPQALSFDPGYVFAPNQGRRYFIGLSYALDRVRE